MSACVTKTILLGKFKGTIEIEVDGKADDIVILVPLFIIDPGYMDLVGFG